MIAGSAGTGGREAASRGAVSRAPGDQAAAGSPARGGGRPQAAARPAPGPAAGSLRGALSKRSSGMQNNRKPGRLLKATALHV